MNKLGLAYTILQVRLATLEREASGHHLSASKPEFPVVVVAVVLSETLFFYIATV